MSFFCDSEANRGNIKGSVVMVLFRIAAWCRALPSPLWWLTIPYLAWYELAVVWGLGIELRYKTKVGAGLGLFHGQGLVVHEGTLIGAGCTLRQNTTSGSKKLANGSMRACLGTANAIPSLLYQEVLPVCDAVRIADERSRGHRSWFRRLARELQPRLGGRAVRFA
jgi:hypothetical protein